MDQAILSVLRRALSRGVFVCALALMLAVPLLAEAQAPGSLSGIVREDSTGRPVSGAVVSVEALKRQTTTDQEGLFRLTDVAAGVRMVTVRRLGYLPSGAMVQFLPNETVEKIITMTKVPAELDTVKVADRAPRVLTGRAAFYERKERSFGRLLDSMDLKKLPELKISDLLMAEPGIQLVHAPPCQSDRINCVVGLRHYAAVTHGLCAMKVVLDDVVLSVGGPIDTTEPSRTNGYRRPDSRYAWYKTFDLTSLNVGTMDKIEIYRRSVEVPMEYASGGTDCGLLLLWSKQ